MSFIQIGNMTIKAEWGAFILALLLFMLVEKLIYKKSDSLFHDTLFYYILVWKFSYIFFEWPLFIKNPISALYFSAGLWGHILGVLIATIILIYRTKKQKGQLDWKDLLDSFVEFYLLMQAGLFLLSGDWVVGIFVLVTAIWMTIKRSNKKNLSYLFILILLNTIFLAYNQKLFASEGWTFISISVFVMCFVVVKEKHLIKNIISWMLIVILASSVALNFEKANKKIALDKAPDFELQTLSGEKVRLSDNHGKKVVLNFWATWCPPCKAEMPHMQNFYEVYGDEIEIIAVNLTSRDNGLDSLERFISEYGLTFNIPLDVNGEYGDLYEVITIPTTYVIDESGQINQKIIGPVDQHTLESFLK